LNHGMSFSGLHDLGVLPHATATIVPPLLREGPRSQNRSRLECRICDGSVRECGASGRSAV
jgi:hypothetical protein